jgi:hypothetical protein
MARPGSSTPFALASGRCGPSACISQAGLPGRNKEFCHGTGQINSKFGVPGLRAGALWSRTVRIAQFISERAEGFDHRLATSQDLFEHLLSMIVGCKLRQPSIGARPAGGVKFWFAKSAIARCAADKAANRFAGEVIIRLVSAAAKELPPHLTRDFPFAATAIVVVATW